jgi:hypothetical protein
VQPVQQVQQVRPVATGAAGTAVAYGQVVINGVGNPAFTINVGFPGSVTEPQAEIFCVQGLGNGTSLPPLVSPVGLEFLIWQVAPEQCGTTAYEFETSSNLSGGEGFTIMLP